MCDVSFLLKLSKLFDLVLNIVSVFRYTAFVPEEKCYIFRYCVVSEYKFKILLVLVEYSNKQRKMLFYKYVRNVTNKRS